MARCQRCNKFMLLKSQSGYCKDCDVLNAEEERRRKEEQERQRKAEEERRRTEEEQNVYEQASERESGHCKTCEMEPLINGVWQTSSMAKMEIDYPKVCSYGVPDYWNEPDKPLVSYLRLIDGTQTFEEGRIVNDVFYPNDLYWHKYILLDKDVLVSIGKGQLGIETWYKKEFEKQINSKPETPMERAKLILFGDQNAAKKFEKSLIRHLLANPYLRIEDINGVIKNYLIANGFPTSEINNLDNSWMGYMFKTSDQDTTYFTLNALRQRF